MDETLQEMLEFSEETSVHLVGTIQAMKQKMYQLIEENNSLKIENTHLRDRLDSLSQGEVKAVREDYGMSNLSKLYDSGVHICHNFYGVKRDESCLLCESLLWQSEK